MLDKFPTLSSLLNFVSIWKLGENDGLKGQSQEVEEERNSKDFNGNYAIPFKGFRYILPDLNILFL